MFSLLYTSMVMAVVTVVVGNILELQEGIPWTVCEARRRALAHRFYTPFNLGRPAPLEHGRQRPHTNKAHGLFMPRSLTHNGGKRAYVNVVKSTPEYAFIVSCLCVRGFDPLSIIWC